MCVSAETSLTEQNKRTVSVNGERESESLPQPVHPVSPLVCAFIKTKSSLASKAPSVMSFSNKTKGNGPHFLLELIVTDLYALKLRGGRARLQTCCRRVPVLVWFGCLAAHHWSVQPAKAGSLAQVASFTQTHFQRFWVSCCPGGAVKAPVMETRTSKLQVYVCVCVTRAGCVHVSNRACYRCCLGPSYNRRHRILSSSGNTNLEGDL